MQGILYVSHGRRIKEATDEAITFINSIKDEIDEPLQEICFLELSEPNMAQGIDELIKKGASRIAVVPVLLLSAGHYFKDIPEEVNRIKANYPHISFTYGEPLGVQERFTDVLVDRLVETGFSGNSDSKILLVGRGSHSPQTKLDIGNIAASLQTKTNIPVDCCFLAACKPSFEQGMQWSIEESYSEIFVVPYLWFTGVLMQSMETYISKIDKKGKSVILCRQLGHHTTMKCALQDRVNEAIYFGTKL